MFGPADCIITVGQFFLGLIYIGLFVTLGMMAHRFIVTTIFSVQQWWENR